MSALSQLKKDLSNLPDILIDYQNKLEGWEDNLVVEGKTLERANSEQPAWISYYDQIRLELEILNDYMEMEVKRSKSRAIKKLYKHSEREYGERMVDKIIEDDPEYCIRQEMYLYSREMYLKAKSIVDNFAHRGYSLNNIVKVRVAQLEGMIID